MVMPCYMHTVLPLVIQKKKRTYVVGAPAYKTFARVYNYAINLVLTPITTAFSKRIYIYFKILFSDTLRTFTYILNQVWIKNQ